MPDIRQSPSGDFVDVGLSVIPAETVLGNPELTTEAPVPMTASEVLDLIGDTVGSILVRGALGWELSTVDDAIAPALTRSSNSAKFWLQANGATKALVAGYNIASTADGGAGNISVVLDTDLALGYTVIGTIGLASTTLVQSVTTTSLLATGFTGLSVVEAGSGANPDAWFFAGYGTYQ